MMSFSVPLLPPPRVPVLLLVLVSPPLVRAPAPGPPAPGALSIQAAAPRLPRVCRRRAPLLGLLGGVLRPLLLLLPVAGQLLHVHADHVPNHLSIRLLGYVNVLGSIGLASSFIISHFRQDLKVRFWTFSTIILIDFGGQVHKEVAVIFNALRIGAPFLCLLDHEVVEGKTIGLG